MPLRTDSPEEVHWARHTVADALSAQLKLLDGYFSLKGWMVAHRRNGEITVLASHGTWRRNGGLAAVGDLMQGVWTAHSDHPGFQCRQLNDPEKLTISDMLKPADSANSADTANRSEERRVGKNRMNM